MALFNAILLVELFCVLTKTKTVFTLMTLYSLYAICYDAFVAYHAHAASVLAVDFVLLLNLPYLLAVYKLFLRPESVRRRKLLFNTQLLNYVFRLICDVWVCANLKADTFLLCNPSLSQDKQLMQELQEKTATSSQLLNSRAQPESLATAACSLQFNLHRFVF